MGYFEIAFLLRSARERSGFTQEELAEKSGFSQVHISRFESGQSNMTVRSLERMAEAMGKKLRICFVEPDTPLNFDAYEVLKGYKQLEVYEPLPKPIKPDRSVLTFDECFVEENGSVRMVRQPSKAYDLDYVRSLPVPEDVCRYPGPYAGAQTSQTNR
ncbi:MAG: helix-turn-helix domain-containing protein [Saccharofermentans sp.]|nr:helix-turn-helix domain-containing protein [Saccharofermentans sp.]